jgi:hypothetical protein
LPLSSRLPAVRKRERAWVAAAHPAKSPVQKGLFFSAARRVAKLKVKAKV